MMSQTNNELALIRDMHEAFLGVGLDLRKWEGGPERFFERALYCMAHAEGLDEASVFAFRYRFVQLGWNDLAKAIENNPGYLESLEGDASQPVLYDGEAKGIYTLTNALGDDPLSVDLIESRIDGIRRIPMRKKEKGFCFFDDNEYFLRPSESRWRHMEIIDKNGLPMAGLFRDGSIDNYLLDCHSSMENDVLTFRSRKLMLKAISIKPMNAKSDPAIVAYYMETRMNEIGGRFLGRLMTVNPIKDADLESIIYQAIGPSLVRLVS